MNPIYEKLVKCADAVKSKIKFQPQVALILGSGLGDYAETMQVEETMEYTEIEGFPVSTVAGHKGRFLFGYVEGVPVVAMQGRVHFYEGYPMQDVVLPVRLMGMLGAKIVMLTNAAGGVNFDFHPGDLMLITDQITTAVPSPLIGPNIEELGVRFPDMSEVYNKELQDVIRKAGANTGVALKEGVYMQFTGPSYETPAEIRMCRTLGVRQGSTLWQQLLWEPWREEGNLFLLPLQEVLLPSCFSLLYCLLSGRWTGSGWLFRRLRFQPCF